MYYTHYTNINTSSLDALQIDLAHDEARRDRHAARIYHASYLSHTYADSMLRYIFGVFGAREPPAPPAAQPEARPEVSFSPAESVDEDNEDSDPDDFEGLCDGVLADQDEWNAREEAVYFTTTHLSSKHCGK